MSRDLSQVLRVGSLRFSVTAAQRVMVWKIRVLVAVHKVSDVWASPGLERTLQRERRDRQTERDRDGERGTETEGGVRKTEGGREGGRDGQRLPLSLWTTGSGPARVLPSPP